MCIIGGLSCAGAGVGAHPACCSWRAPLKYLAVSRGRVYCNKCVSAVEPFKCVVVGVACAESCCFTGCFLCFFFVLEFYGDLFFLQSLGS
jgi:hypothetical protein